MSDTELFFIGGILVLLLASILPLVFATKSKPFFRKFSLFLVLLGCLSLSFFSFQTLNDEGLSNGGTTFSITVTGLRFSLVVDQLAAFFILVISIIAFCTGIYSFSYAEHIAGAVKRNLLVSLMAVFVVSMILTVASHHLLAFLFFWEMMSLSSFILVMFDYEKEETKKAGIFYFVMTQLSTAFLLLAFIIIYNYTGSLELSELGGLSSGIISLLFVLLTIGFGIKAGIIPFHKWLPYAHPASPSSISALMSGVMIKVAIYGILRFIFLLPKQKLWWGVTILILGTVSAVLGVIYALKEHDLKRLLAYHSIENIGIIFMGIGLYIIFLVNGFKAIAMIALAAALFHTLNHALFKSLLFLSAGAVIQATHTKNIEELGGLVKTMPYTAVLFLIGAISISALPPFNGFVSELMIFEVFFKTGILSSPLLKVILFLSLSLFAMTSALAAACFVKAFGMVFLALPRSQKAAEAKEVPWAMRIAPAILAFFCISLGVFSFQIFQIIGEKTGFDFPLPNLLWISAIASFFILIIFVILRFISVRKSRISETWGCGILSQNAKMEYTASGFSEPIVTIFSLIYRAKKINQREYYDSGSTAFKQGHAEITLSKFFEEYLYLPIAGAVQRVSSSLYTLQNKVELDSYILYGFCTVVLLLIILGWAA